jgi:hypothetical protein
MAMVEVGLVFGAGADRVVRGLLLASAARRGTTSVTEVVNFMAVSLDSCRMCVVFRSLEMMWRREKSEIWMRCQVASDKCKEKY